MPSTSSFDADRLRDGRTVLYHSATLVIQTLFFGGYSSLIVFAGNFLLKRGLRTKATKTLFWLSLSIYGLSAAYWLYSIVEFVARMQFFIDPNDPAFVQLFNHVTTPYNFFNAVMLVNFSITDGIVVWRAWVICPRTRLHRRLLWLPIILFFITIAFTFILIIIRFAKMVSPAIADRPFFTPLIDSLQFLSVILSFFSNVSSTALIGATAWRHRKQLKTAVMQKSKAEQTLQLLLDSGLLYCAATLFFVLALCTRLSHGTLGDLWFPTTVQIAGAYAPAMLLLIMSNSSESDTDFIGTRTTALSRLKFATGQEESTVVGAGSQSATNLDMSATASSTAQKDFDRALEAKQLSMV
ncbi:hypothetical protein MKEN_00709400 [Mycena kentingensis (nom. inval.)]|nr:hypothetical protein MKEN_00709400 [Mycena kentingensis (nom. inval.)]